MNTECCQECRNRYQEGYEKGFKIGRFVGYNSRGHLSFEELEKVVESNKKSFRSGYSQGYEDCLKKKKREIKNSIK